MRRLIHSEDGLDQTVTRLELLQIAVALTHALVGLIALTHLARFPLMLTLEAHRAKQADHHSYPRKAPVIIDLVHLAVLSLTCGTQIASAHVQILTRRVHIRNIRLTRVYVQVVARLLLRVARMKLARIEQALPGLQHDLVVRAVVRAADRALGGAVRLLVAGTDALLQLLRLLRPLVDAETRARLEAVARLRRRRADAAHEAVRVGPLHQEVVLLRHLGRLGAQLAAVLDLEADALRVLGIVRRATTVAYLLLESALLLQRRVQTHVVVRVHSIYLE